MQQVYPRRKDPWCAKTDLRGEYPKLGEDVYVGSGAKILGGVTVGAWAITGAKAGRHRGRPARRYFGGLQSDRAPRGAERDECREAGIAWFSAPTFAARSAS